jgi:hypothetical protein
LGEEGALPHLNPMAEAEYFSRTECDDIHQRLRNVATAYALFPNEKHLNDFKRSLYICAIETLAPWNKKNGEREITRDLEKQKKSVEFFLRLNELPASKLPPSINAESVFPAPLFIYYLSLIAKERRQITRRLYSKLQPYHKKTLDKYQQLADDCEKRILKGSSSNLKTIDSHSRLITQLFNEKNIFENNDDWAFFILPKIKRWLELTGKYKKNHPLWIPENDHFFKQAAYTVMVALKYTDFNPAESKISSKNRMIIKQIKRICRVHPIASIKTIFISPVINGRGDVIGVKRVLKKMKKEIEASHPDASLAELAAIYELYYKLMNYTTS